jgi:hypothetical protein
MPYIGNVTTSSNVNGSQINNGTITGDKLSLPFDYDSATLYLDNTNNRVGILTASPSSTLTVGTGGVVSIPLASAATPSLVFGTDTNTGIYSPGADQVAISTNGTGRLFVDASGNVGVGTASPAAKLDVNGKTIVSNEGANPLNLYKYGTASPSILMYGANGTAASPTQTLTGDVIAGLNAFGRGSSDWAGGPSVRITAIATENNGGTSNRGADIKFETVATGGTSLQERLRLTSAGLVGIGTSSPSTKLEISGNEATANFIVATNTDAFAWSGFRLRNTGTSGRSYDIGLGGNSSGASTAGNFYVYDNTAGAQRITLDSSGRVGIGTTSPRSLLSFGTADTSGTNGINLYDNGGNYRTGIGATSSYLRLYTPSDGSLQLGRLSTSDGSTFLEAVRIDSSGRLLVGTSTARSIATQSWGIQQEGTTYSNTGISLTANRNDADSAYLVFAKTRGTSVGSVTSVNSQDNLGGIFFAGADGSTVNSYGASIVGKVDGTPGANDMPGRLVFSTTADGAASPTERLRITSAGRVGIGSTTVDNKLQVVGDVGIGDIGTSGTYDLYWAPNTAGGSVRWFRSEGSAFSLGIGTTAGISEHLKVDGSGRLLVGTSTTSQDSLLVVEGSSNSGTGASIARFCRGEAQPTTNQSLAFLIFGNNAHSPGAWINAAADGNWSTSTPSYPTRLVFSTTADGAASPTERMRITSAGRVGIGSQGPSSKLTVTGSSSAADQAILISAGGNYPVQLALDNGYGARQGVVFANNGSGGYTSFGIISENTGLAIKTASYAIGGSSDLNSGWTERLRVDASGRLLVNTSTGHGTLQVHDGTFVLSKPATGSERNWRLLPSDAAAGDLAIQQSTTAGGTTYSSKLAIGADGSFSSVIPGGSTLYPRFGCRAWVNFNGTGTVAIRGSGNVSSITDNGTGDYTVNFTTAMPDVNYAIAMSGYRDTTGSSYAAQASGQTYTVSACRVNTYNAAFAYFDAQSVSFQVFR